MGSSLSKENYHKFLKATNSSPDASDGCDYQQFMFLHHWKVRNPPLPPPPPSPLQQKRLRLINDFSSIAGKLIHIQPENFQLKRIPHRSYKSAVTRSLTSRSESA